MNDQQRIETAADNCEVLRARLARYEDADGKPITTIAEQAREIERLQLTCNDLDDQNDRIYAELAELKAQPGRVVMPDSEHMQDMIDRLCDSASKEDAVFGWHECLEFVARLNSSPVSAGDDAQYPPCDYCAEPLSYHPWHGSGPINGVESRHIHACDKCRHLLPTVSAGDDRETIRAVFLRNGFTIKEGQADLKPYVYAAAGELMSIARAALSAPSHGEQVREWSLAADELPSCGKPVLAYYLNSHGMGRRIRAMHVKRFTVEAEEFADPETQCCEYSEQDDCYYTTEGWYELIDNWPDYSSCAVIEGVITHWMPLPAAPSAGSQKERGHD